MIEPTTDRIAAGARAFARRHGLPDPTPPPPRPEDWRAHPTGPDILRYHPEWVEEDPAATNRAGA